MFTCMKVGASVPGVPRHTTIITCVVQLNLSWAGTYCHNEYCSYEAGFLSGGQTWFQFSSKCGPNYLTWARTFISCVQKTVIGPFSKNVTNIGQESISLCCLFLIKADNKVDVLVVMITPVKMSLKFSMLLSLTLLGRCPSTQTWILRKITTFSWNCL